MSGVVERRQTMPVLADVRRVGRDHQLSITATDLDLDLDLEVEVELVAHC